MTERQPRGPERPRSGEHQVSTEITPVIARIIDTQTVDTDTGKKLTYDRVNKASLASRKKFYEGNTDDFESRREKWVKGLTTWVEKKTDESEPDHQERASALASVGINIQDTTALSDQVENFRQKYLDKDKSKVGEFVGDIAKDCENDEGGVDLKKLGKRLHDIKDMLVVFGTDKEINTLVEEFVIAHGNVTQKDNKATMQKVAEKMSEEVEPEAHERLKAIGIDPDLVNPSPSPISEEREKPIKVELPEKKEPALEGEVLNREEEDIHEQQTPPETEQRSFKVIKGEFREVKQDQAVQEESKQNTENERILNRDPNARRQGHPNRKIKEILKSSDWKTIEEYEALEDKSTYPFLKVQSDKDIQNFNNLLNRMIEQELLTDSQRKDLQGKIKEHLKEVKSVTIRVFKGEDNKPIIDIKNGPRKPN